MSELRSGVLLNNPNSESAKRTKKKGHRSAVGGTRRVRRTYTLGRNPRKDPQNHGACTRQEEGPVPMGAGCGGRPAPHGPVARPTTRSRKCDGSADRRSSPARVGRWHSPADEPDPHDHRPDHGRGAGPGQHHADGRRVPSRSSSVPMPTVWPTTCRPTRSSCDGLTINSGQDHRRGVGWFRRQTNYPIYAATERGPRRDVDSECRYATPPARACSTSVRT